MLEAGPTGIELTIRPPNRPPIVVATHADADWAPRLATVVAELSKIRHGVGKRSYDELGGWWADRWSWGFYLSAASFNRHAELAVATGATTCALGPEPQPRLASCFATYGLPARAASHRALQEGGWLARRYASGPPWPHVAASLGHATLPSSNTAPAGLYQLLPRPSATSSGCPAGARASYTTRASDLKNSTRSHAK